MLPYNKIIIYIYIYKLKAYNIILFLLNNLILNFSFLITNQMDIVIGNNNEAFNYVMHVRSTWGHA